MLCFQMRHDGWRDDLIKKIRVWCLYRVSAKKQVSTDDDIPMQKSACREFVNTKSNWEITNELYEKGVSGWSKKAVDRGEMNLIRAGAIKKEFDVLLVFMNDRLGRREDETPFVVQFLIEQGVEVWSVQEGQTKIEHHVDKLMNFITFWQSAGESKKTSIRSREGKKESSEKGYFQGGSAPYGYKIIETDQPHWKVKDRMLKELAIDEDEAELVKLIFSMYTDKHMGARKIVDYLNENGYRTRKDYYYVATTIQRILQNPVYIGKKRFVGFDGKEGDTQAYNEKLRIVSDDVFNMAQQIRKSRTDKPKKQDKTEIPLAGKLMFSGLAFCKYCEKKLYANYRYDKVKDKKTNKIYTVISYRYQCSMDYGKIRGNHQQSIFGAIKYDEMAIKKIKQIFSKLDLKSYIEISVKQKKKQITQKEKNIKVLEKEINGYKKQLAKLNSEIVMSLMGESNFKPEQLSSAISGTEEQLQNATVILNNLLEEIMKERDNYSDTNYIANELNDWESKFDNADNDLKKAMLSRVIHNIYLGKDEVRIRLNLALHECLGNLEGISVK